MLGWLPFCAALAVCSVCVALIACQEQPEGALEAWEVATQEHNPKRACAACVYDECGYAYEECAENEACLQLSKCRSECEDDRCRTRCERDHVAGVEDREDLTDCTLALCSEVCMDD